jgi:hypothetical protein
MAESYTNPAQGTPAARDYRAWVLGVGIVALSTLAVGLWLALLTDGVARPWIGLGYLLALALALIVGVSKTSSA